MKILFFDIETAPCKAYIWSLWQEVTSADFIEQDWYILCWSAKWLGEKKILHDFLPNHALYKKDPTNDKEILETLWKLLDEADIVVAHNGEKFDKRKVNTRFIINGMKPPSPYRMVDTRIAAKRYFAFTSNRLNDLGKFLHLGKKVDTGGFSLWKQCLAGDLNAWKRMVKYCDGDILLLEKLYLEMRPYILTHPNLLSTNETACPKCGSSSLQKRGYSYTSSTKYQRFVCTSCGGWGRENLNLITKDEKTMITRNILQ